MKSRTRCGFPRAISTLALWGLLATSVSAATVWHVGTGRSAADSNPGTAERPLATVLKAASLAKPGDTVIFSPGIYPCSAVRIPDGSPDLPIILRSESKKHVIFTNDGSRDQLILGSYNTVDGIEFQMLSDRPRGHGITVVRKAHTIIRNCRFLACQVGVSTVSTHYLTITNCEMAYSGAYGIHINGSGEGTTGHWDPADECRFVEVRNCYLHDAGWIVPGTEGYGITANGAVEYLAIENCQIDNNSGDGILYEDWAPFSAIDPKVYGENLFLFTSNTRDAYFDNNTVAFNNCQRVVAVESRPPLNAFRNIWFRNNIFWKNTGGVGSDAGVDFSQFHFLNNLWDKPYQGDTRARTGDPLFVDPVARTAEGYKLRSGSAARDQGMLLYENPLDFWNAPRPHLSKTEKYDVGAHEFGATGTAHCGLDRSEFPFEVPPFRLQFRAKPKR